MTPAEQYRTLINRLQILAEAYPQSAYPDNAGSDTISGVSNYAAGAQLVKQRAENILNKMRVLSGKDRGILQVISVTSGYANVGSSQAAFGTSPNNIYLSYPVFWDAPDSVLAFVIAHEVGHLIQHRRGMINRVPQSSVSANPKYAQEYDADERAANMALKLGYSKAEAWKWLQDMQQYSEVTAPDNPEKPVGRLSIETGKEVFTPYSKNKDTHPSFKARADRVNKKVPGFTLSQLDQVEQAIQSA
jgi:hypothetical protein